MYFEIYLDFLLLFFAGDVVNNAINANFAQFVNELRPSIERALSTTMLDISNRVVRSFTQDQLFPQD